MTERTRSWLQVVVMSFLRRVAGLSHIDRVRSCIFQGELGVELLLLHVKRSQLGRRGRDLVRMPSRCLPLEGFRHVPHGRDTLADVELAGLDS